MTRIPVYRRELAPDIGFTTFSPERTMLLGWIMSDRISGYPARIPGDHSTLFGHSAEAALAYARVGTAGLKFESVIHEKERETYKLLWMFKPDDYVIGERVEMEVSESHNPPVDPKGPKDKDGKPIRFIMKPPTEVRFDTKELQDQMLGAPPEKTWRDRAIKKPML